MIPIALTAPPAPQTHASPVGAVIRAVAVVLLLASVAGLFTWYLVLSPFGFRRWSSAEVVTDIHVNEPGTYVVFEEFPGASGDQGSNDPRLSLRSSAGRKIDSVSLLDSNGHSSTMYHTFLYEGRGVASFAIDKPGDYRVSSFGSSAPKLAFAPEGRPGFLGGIGGLVMLFVLPFSTSVVIGLFARGRWPRAGAASRTSSSTQVGAPS